MYKKTKQVERAFFWTATGLLPWKREGEKTGGQMVEIIFK